MYGSVFLPLNKKKRKKIIVTFYLTIVCYKVRIMIYKVRIP